MQIIDTMVDYSYDRQRANQKTWEHLSPSYYSKDGVHFDIPAEPICMKKDGTMRTSIYKLIQLYLTLEDTKVVCKKLAAKGVTVWKE